MTDEFKAKLDALRIPAQRARAIFRKGPRTRLITSIDRNGNARFYECVPGSSVNITLATLAQRWLMGERFNADSATDCAIIEEATTK